MHTVHLLDNKEKGFFAGVQGIIFDTKNYDKSVTDKEIEIIDAFFDSLNMDKILPEKNANNKMITEVPVGYVPYGQLMSML